jgi:carboxylesterase
VSRQMTASSAPASLMPGAEPFHFEAPGQTACLLVHGFTGSAYELRELGLYLAERGISARGVLLCGHGTRPEDMRRYSYRDWIADVETALDEMLADGNSRVFLGGLSMGGTLALNVAARRSHDPRLAGVIALAAPLRLADWRLSLLPFAGWLWRWHSWGRPDIKDESKWENHVAYRRFHVRAVVQLMRLLRETRQLAARVHQPLLVIQSRQDNTVPTFNAELILRTVCSEARRLLWLDNCYHVVTLDYDSERVRQEVAAFIQEHSNACEPGTH